MPMQFYQAGRAELPDYVGAASRQADIEQQKRNAEQLRKQGMSEAAMGVAALDAGGALSQGVGGLLGVGETAAATEAAGALGGGASLATVPQAALTTAGEAALGAGAAGAGAAGAGAAGAGAAGAGAAGSSGILASMGPIGWAALGALALNSIF